MNWDVVHHPTYWVGSTTGEFKRTELAYPHVPKGHPVFAQSMVIGNLVFVSGCTGQDTVKGTPTPDTIDGQMANGLNGAKAALETAGSSMERIVKTFILTRNASDYERIREIELDFYRRHAPALVADPPPSTLIVVESLAKPEFLFEFEVIATLADDMPSWQRQRHEGVDVVGNFAIIAGCQPTGDDGKVVAEDFDSQVRAVLDRMRQRMEAAGGRLDGLVKTHLFVKNLADVERYRILEQAYLAQHASGLAKQPAASTAIVVEDLSNRDIQLEVDAFGVIASDDPNWPIEVVPGNASAAASVSAGRLVFLSGIDGSDPVSGEIQSDDIEQQIILALDKVKAAMEAAGSSLDNVLRTLMMLRRLDDYPTMRSTEVSYYEQHAPQLVAKPPVSTFLQLPSITRPRALFQIDVIGWR